MSLARFLILPPLPSPSLVLNYSFFFFSLPLFLSLSPSVSSISPSLCSMYACMHVCMIVFIYRLLRFTVLLPVFVSLPLMCFQTWRGQDSLIGWARPKALHVARGVDFGTRSQPRSALEPA